MHHPRNAHQDVSGSAAEAIREIAAAFAEHDWICRKDFLSAPRIAGLRREAETLRAAGHFHAAGIGKAGERREEIRGDDICWVDAERAPLAAGLQGQELAALREALNATTYLGLEDFEGHFAAYPAGAGYARHLDRFRDDDRRVVSLVLYLNDAWDAGDGGELCLYAGGGEERPALKLSPQGGTLVCFLSGRVPHEVLVAHRTRWSLTGWFRRRA